MRGVVHTLGRDKGGWGAMANAASAQWVRFGRVLRFWSEIVGMRMGGDSRGGLVQCGWFELAGLAYRCERMLALGRRRGDGIGLGVGGVVGELAEFGWRRMATVLSVRRRMASGILGGGRYSWMGSADGGGWRWRVVRC